jgi:hypothetical protein
MSEDSLREAFSVRERAFFVRDEKRNMRLQQRTVT